MRDSLVDQATSVTVRCFEGSFDLGDAVEVRSLGSRCEAAMEQLARSWVSADARGSPVLVYCDAGSLRVSKEPFPAEPQTVNGRVLSIPAN